MFLFDRLVGATTLVNHAVNAPTSSAAGISYGPRLSMDGRFVAFQSSASNLISGMVDEDFAINLDVFLYDRLTGAMTLVSHASGLSATTGNGGSDLSQISLDGRFDVFGYYE